LITQIEEFGKYILITGFRNVEVKNVEEFLKLIKKEKKPNVEIQFFDSRFIATWQHIYFAILNTLTAFKDNKNISKNIAIETMLYASAQRQIKKAINLLGIKSRSTEISMFIIADKLEVIEPILFIVSRYLNSKPDDTTLALSKKKIEFILKTFRILDIEYKNVTKKAELEKTLINIIIEKMALLATEC